MSGPDALPPTPAAHASYTTLAPRHLELSDADNSKSAFTFEETLDTAFFKHHLSSRVEFEEALVYKYGIFSEKGPQSVITDTHTLPKLLLKFAQAKAAKKAAEEADVKQKAAKTEKVDLPELLNKNAFYMVYGNLVDGEQEVDEDVANLLAEKIAAQFPIGEDITQIEVLVNIFFCLDLTSQMNILRALRPNANLKRIVEYFLGKWPDEDTKGFLLALKIECIVREKFPTRFDDDEFSKACKEFHEKELVDGMQRHYFYAFLATADNGILCCLADKAEALTSYLKWAFEFDTAKKKKKFSVLS